MLNRSKGRYQTKSDPLVLQVGKPDALMIQPKWRVLLLEPSGCSWAKASRSPKANMSHSSPQETDHHWLPEHKDHSRGNVNNVSCQRWQDVELKCYLHDEFEGKESLNGMDANQQEDH